MGGYADIDFCIFYFCVQKSLVFDEKFWSNLVICQMILKDFDMFFRKRVTLIDLCKNTG